VQSGAGSTISDTPSPPFALRAGISTFDLSRYMGASLTIDRHYGYLARAGREHAIKLLDAINAPEFEPWTLCGADASRLLHREGELRNSWKRALDHALRFGDRWNVRQRM